MKNVLAHIVVGTIILAGFCAGMSEYPADNFFGNIPKCLFLSTGLLLAVKSFVLVKRSLSKRFKFSTVTKAAGIVLVIILAYLYLCALGIIASKIWPNHNLDTKYDNKYVFLDESNPKDPKFKTYSDIRAATSALKAKEVQLKDWIIVFTDPNDSDAFDSVGAVYFIEAMMTENEEKRCHAITVATCFSDVLFKKGFVCSTFPSAKTSDDIYECVYVDVSKILSSFQKETCP